MKTTQSVDCAARRFVVGLAVACTILSFGRAGAQPPASTGARTPIYRVSGSVFDSLASEPLVNAIVAIRPAGITTTTDSTGRFLVASNQPATEITAYHSALDDIGLWALTATRGEGEATGSMCGWLHRRRPRCGPCCATVAAPCDCVQPS